MPVFIVSIPRHTLPPPEKKLIEFVQITSKTRIGDGWVGMCPSVATPLLFSHAQSNPIRAANKICVVFYFVNFLRV